QRIRRTGVEVDPRDEPVVQLHEVPPLLEMYDRLETPSPCRGGEGVRPCCGGRRPRCLRSCSGGIAGATRRAMKDFAGRVGVVTGAARGIGFAVSRSLLQRGMRVVVSDVDVAQPARAAVALAR